MAEKRLEEVRHARLAKRQALIDAGLAPYPSEVRRTHTIRDLTENFDDLSANQTAILTIGRVWSVRKHGGLVFADLVDASGKIQLQISREQIQQPFFDRLQYLDNGDWVEVAGSMITTQRGVKSINVSAWHIVSKSIRALPDSWYGLKDHETRYRQREVDLLINGDIKAVFDMRSRIISWLREYLTRDGYIEVETPELQAIAGGAAARPFITHHNTLDIDLYLRIATELHLKRLLVGGYEKVFEIGKRFRNEGIDRQHNPEFTMLETQWAFADYEDLMEFTEDIMERMVSDLTGGTDILWQDVNLSFKKPFKRVRYVDVVSTELGVDILQEKDPAVYLKIFSQRQLELPEAKNYYQLVDELYKKIIRPKFVQPTLVYDYPAEMAPLAKTSINDPRIAEKLQLIVNGMELSNCYTELNDPVRQREMFEAQEQARQEGDQEAQQIDEEYLRAMEYGMPPNAGWSLGIDRFVMLMTNTTSVRDTILFPLLRPEND